MKNILTILFLLITTSVFAQFRMIGTGSWSTVNDSTYTSTITFQSDLTGQGYLATQIVDTFRLFTPLEKVYRVDSVWNQTFSTAEVRVVEFGTTDGIPMGQLMVYDPAGKNTVPQAPFGSTGSTAQMQAAVDTYNARQTTVGGGSNQNLEQVLIVGNNGGQRDIENINKAVFDSLLSGSIEILDEFKFSYALNNSTVVASKWNGGQTALTLPLGGFADTRIWYNANGNDITVTGTSGETINGQGSYNLPTGQSAIFIFDETSDWNVMASTGGSGGTTIINNGSNCRDTITVTGIGTTVGTIPSQGFVLLANRGGTYVSASTADGTYLPDLFVTEVIDANTVVSAACGWFPSSGLQADSTYYLQDNGTVNIAPDADLNAPVLKVNSEGNAVRPMFDYVFIDVLNTDSQTLSLVGTDLSIQNGNTVDLAPIIPEDLWTDAGTYTHLNSTSDLLGIGFNTAPSGKFELRQSASGDGQFGFVLTSSDGLRKLFAFHNGTDLFFQYGGIGYTKFGTGTTATSTNIGSSGSIGIKMLPSNTLDVNGTVGISSTPQISNADFLLARTSGSAQVSSVIPTEANNFIVQGSHFAEAHIDSLFFPVLANTYTSAGTMSKGDTLNMQFAYSGGNPVGIRNTGNSFQGKYKLKVIATLSHDQAAAQTITMGIFSSTAIIATSERKLTVQPNEEIQFVTEIIHGFDTPLVDNYPQFKMLTSGNLIVEDLQFIMSRP